MTPRLRVCHAIFSNPWSPLAGGGQLAVHALCEAMSSLGHEVHALFSGMQRPARATYRVHLWPALWVGRYNLDAVPQALKLWRLLRRERFDTVFGHSVNAVLFPLVCRRHGVPFVYVFHGSWLAERPQRSLRSRLRVLVDWDYHLVRRALCDADRVVVFSDWSRRYLQERIRLAPAKIEVVSPGLDPAWSGASWKGGDGRRVVHWGRLAPGKGVDDLLRAFARVRAELPTALLTIIGCGPSERALRRLAHELDLANAVRWKGSLPPDRLVEEVAGHDLAVFASHIESYGFAVAEARAVGMPVVCTAAGALPEVLAGYPSATMVPIADAPALARGIVASLRERRAAHVDHHVHTWAPAAARLIAPLCAS